LKLFLGATAWQYAAFLFDGDVTKHDNTGKYILRAIIVGLADATFCCLGALISEIIEASLGFFNFLLFLIRGYRFME
jgi:hypothetical protein